MRFLLLLLFCLGCGAPAWARDGYFTASDGAKLHYTEAGPDGAPLLLFVPGWTMPGLDFRPADRSLFDQHYHVVAFDPRGQGAHEITPGGYDQDRRGRDIGELVAYLHPAAGAADRLVAGRAGHAAWVHQRGERGLAGLVLMDNSVGENPPPRSRPGRPRHPPRRTPCRRGGPRGCTEFVCGMFHTSQQPRNFSTA